MKEALEKSRYPIGKFVCPDEISDALFQEWLQKIADFPDLLKEEVQNLSEEALRNTYREEGWTIAQLVHHCADSHLNSFIRFKLALTESDPTIKPYLEDQWALLPDASIVSIGYSLLILEGLHARWAALLANLTDEMRNRTFVHPETKQRISLRINTGIYAWHGEHHLAHIRLAKKNAERRDT